ncbi:MAG TPA: hypothetical protein VHG91_03475 [Longimicrobium sp.]|nr:hypothetical protein [Longimicrobium sp.]
MMTKLQAPLAAALLAAGVGASEAPRAMARDGDAAVAAMDRMIREEYRAEAAYRRALRDFGRCRPSRAPSTKKTSTPT